MPRLLTHLLVLGLLATAFGLAGVALERALLRGGGAGPLRPLARAVLGVTGWMAGLFLVASAGVLGPTSVLAGVALSVAGAAVARRRDAPADAASGAAVAAVLVLACSPLLLVALGPEVSWDASAYHLTLPRRFLEAGGFVAVPMNVYNHWPLGTELLYAAAMAISDYPVAKALHWGLGVAALWAAALGARAFGRPEAGWLAAPLVLANPVWLFEMGVAYVDLASAFFFTGGVLFLTRWRERGDDAVSLRLAGVCGGALAAVKVTGVLGAAALGAVALPRWLAIRRARGARAAAVSVAHFAVPVLLLWTPWLVRSALLSGNPVHPFLYDWFGGPDWSPALGRELAAWQRSIGMGRGPLDVLLLPVRVILHGGPDYAHFAGALGRHWIVLLPLAVLCHRIPLVRVALVASGVHFALWAAGSQQMRFLLPILPALGLACGVAIGEGVRRLPERLRRVATALALAVAVALALRVAERPLARARAEAADWLRDPVAWHAPPLTPAERFVATLPPDARLLLLDTNQAFFLEREVLADSFFEASQIADWLADTRTAREAHARLRARGITHVLDGARDWGIEWPPGLVRLLDDPSLAAPRFRAPDGSARVYELR